MHALVELILSSLEGYLDQNAVSPKRAAANPHRASTVAFALLCRIVRVAVSCVVVVSSMDEPSRFILSVHQPDTLLPSTSRCIVTSAKLGTRP